MLVGMDFLSDAGRVEVKSLCFFSQNSGQVTDLKAGPVVYLSDLPFYCNAADPEDIWRGVDHRARGFGRAPRREDFEAASESTSRPSSAIQAEAASGWQVLGGRFHAAFGNGPKSTGVGARRARLPPSPIASGGARAHGRRQSWSCRQGAR